MTRTLPPALALALLAALSGCGDDQFLHDVYPVTGTVTLDGRPVDGALVSFHPVDPKALAIPEGREGPQVASPTTQTDGQGRFTLSTYYAGDGAPAGDYKVTVVWAPPVLVASNGEQLSDDDLASGEFTPRKAKVKPYGDDKLKGQFADPEATPLEATVTPEGPNDFDFALDAEAAETP